MAEPTQMLTPGPSDPSDAGDAAAVLERDIEQRLQRLECRYRAVPGGLITGMLWRVGRLGWVTILESTGLSGWITPRATPPGGVIAFGVALGALGAVWAWAALVNKSRARPQGRMGILILKSP